MNASGPIRISSPSSLPSTLGAHAAPFILESQGTAISNIDRRRDNAAHSRRSLPKRDVRALACSRRRQSPTPCCLRRRGRFSGPPIAKPAQPAPLRFSGRWSCSAWPPILSAARPSSSMGGWAWRAGGMSATHCLGGRERTRSPDVTGLRFASASRARRLSTAANVSPVASRIACVPLCSR